MSSTKSLAEFFLYFIDERSNLPRHDPSLTHDGWVNFDPGPARSTIPPNEFSHVGCGSRDFPVLLIMRSLLRYSPHPENIALDLCESIQANNDAKNHFYLLLQFGPPNTLGPNGCPTTTTRLGPKNRSWNEVASRFERSTFLGRACKSWVKRWVESLLLGFASYGGTPATPSLNTSNTSSRGGRQQKFRETILQRDGYITSIGKHLARDCPKNDYPDPSTYTELFHVQACHIIPHSSNRNSALINAIKIFGGESADQLLTDVGVNHPSNGLMLSKELHSLYSEDFLFGIEAVQTNAGTKYYFRRIGNNIDLGNTLRSISEGQELHFGGKDSSIPLPSAYYCNLQLAIARILRASRAGQTIKEIIRDEDELKGQTGATWGPSGQAYLTRMLTAF